VHAAGAAESEGFPAVIATGVGTLGCVGFPMRTEFRGDGEGGIALVTLVWSSSRMANQMVLQVEGRGQPLAAYMAHMFGGRRLLTPLLVNLQQDLVVGFLAALGARMRQWKI